MKKRLGEFIAEMRGVERVGGGAADPDILGVACDSREVAPGFLFAVIPGNAADGARYIGDAVRNGAAALLISAPPPREYGIPCLVAGDVRKALGESADLFHGRPSRSLDLIGVTGTNGKTTTAYLLRHIFNTAGGKCGMTGTIEYDLGGRTEAAPLTTPDAARFTRLLAEMRDSGCTAAAVEVSSHALSQHRVWPHRFAAALFTNLTRDHLDYHGDMERYLEAKRLLFLGLDGDAAAILNFRDPAAARMAEGTSAKVLGYFLADGGGSADGAAGGAFGDTLRAEIVESTLSGQTFRAEGCGIEREFRTPQIGRHNAENCLGAILCARALGADQDAIARAIASFPGVPGRMERIDSGTGVKAFVDYSHTPDSLRAALSVLRPLVRGRLIAVFGCGGDRDQGKRPLMAKAAEDLADRVVITSDNPRSEDPDAILDAVMAGFAKPENVLRESDRPAAVRLAAGLARPGDAILVAGKGHEQYQTTATATLRMDDRDLVRDAFATTRKRAPQ